MNDNTDSQLEQKMVNQLAREFLQEQRSHRRWSIFFKSLLALYLFTFLTIYLAGEWELGSLGGEKHTALVDINGVISMDSEANADYLATGLRAAFKDKNTAGVILRINSPGGSPVQSGYINDEIRRLREKYPDIPLYAVIGDLCASGGYYIASAADKIYADKASLVGSIGVIMAGFGFVDSIEKLGIERRVRHAGESKAFLDPFSPQKDAELAHVDNLLDGVYQQFIATVKQGRGDRLANDERIFSGLVWTGEQAIELGLVDALGSAGYVAREVIGEEEIVDFTRRENYLDRFAGSLGTQFANRLESFINYQLK
ncbi:MAG: protease-4 [Gammaproteobacteria bacterium]|jgi:protease-4